MKFGLTPSQYKYITENVVSPLVELGLKIYCFGSRARGDYHKFSDLDLMIEGESSEKAQRLKSQIEEQLSNENFPYKVDLVFIGEYADSYKKSYDQDRRPWV